MKAEMGIIIFGLAAGSLVGLISTGHIISRIGARSVILWSALLILTGFTIVGVGTELSIIGMVFGGLAIFGCGLVGPPGLGFLGEHYGLLNALVTILIGVIVAGLISGVAKPVVLRENK